MFSVFPAVLLTHHVQPASLICASVSLFLVVRESHLSVWSCAEQVLLGAHHPLFSPCLQMRMTRKVSVWPVAFVGGLRYESPKVNAAGKVYGWKTVFDPHRPFAIDMAGFAVNLRLILQRSQAYFKLRGVKGGYQESSLLRELVTLNDLEPKAANCTKVRSLPSHAGSVWAHSPALILWYIVRSNILEKPWVGGMQERSSLAFLSQLSRYGQA